MGSQKAANSLIKRQESGLSCDSGDDIEKLTHPGDILYPDIIKRQQTHMGTFRKQFNDVIERQLQKKMRAPEISIEEMKDKFKKLKINQGGLSHFPLTLVIGLDGFLMKTSVFPKEIPRVDAQFSYNNIKVYVCFRPHFREFIEGCAKIFELILWSSSPPEYTEKLFITLPENLQLQFRLRLDQSSCLVSTDDSLRVKNLSILTDYED